VGIDIHNLNLLAHAKDIGVRFDRTIAIGRQALFMKEFELEQHRRLRGLALLQEPPIIAGQPRYFEPLIRQWLGAAVADSVDASSYENARFIHDLNLPWQTDSVIRGGYDAVLDLGCLEHVFNFPVAWRNCVDLCSVNGHILHSLPVNNLAGHGFYQFSPELFFNIYQEQNGFELRGLWFAMKADRLHWWKVANPMEVKRRVNLCNSYEVYMLVIARKLRDVGPLSAPQQSDYSQAMWVCSQRAASAGTDANRARREVVLRQIANWGMIDVMRAGRERLRAIMGSGIDLPQPDYQRVNVRSLIERKQTC
jgi:hypothetical protein